MTLARMVLLLKFLWLHRRRKREACPDERCQAKNCRIWRIESKPLQPPSPAQRPRFPLASRNLIPGGSNCATPKLKSYIVIIKDFESAVLILLRMLLIAESSDQGNLQDNQQLHRRCEPGEENAPRYRDEGVERNCNHG